MQTLLMVALFLIAVFLILLVLVQRGRGGGLAGALGGAGGSSAFGAKAGDNFTWFTIYMASAWIVLCVVAAAWSKNSLTDKLGDEDPVTATATVDFGAGEGGAGEGGIGAAPAEEGAASESAAEETSKAADTEGADTEAESE